MIPSVGPTSIIFNLFSGLGSKRVFNFDVNNETSADWTFYRSDLFLTTEPYVVGQWCPVPRNYEICLI